VRGPNLRRDTEILVDGHTAVQTMVPLRKLSRVDPNAELWTALGKMRRDGINQTPVTRRDSLVGMLSKGDIVKHQTLQQVRS
jgi:CBS domain-containing protein